VPVWHASVASTEDGGGGIPRPLQRHERRIARELAELLLAGVGQKPSRTDFTSSRVVHVRLALSPPEVAGLPAAWLAIPPEDMAGGSGPGALSELEAQLQDWDRILGT